MSNSQRNAYVLRDSIMNLLSDQEVASVSTAETAARLLDGEEYFDLEQLERGVQQATKTAAVMGRVLPRRAVHKETWNKILTLLGPTHCAEGCSKPHGAKAKSDSPA